MQKILIIVGTVIILAGLLWPFLSKIPFGRLPGDIIIERENFKFYFPIVTMIIISGLLSMVIWLIRKFF